jgi:glutamyl/glutaminyl-tRNA synthetase
MLNPNGKKLSKRHATPEFLISVHQYMEQGFLPEALLNFVALVGWNPGGEQEIFTLDELVQLFSLERVVKSNAVYDFNRAMWFNSQYLSKMEESEFIDKTIAYLKEHGGDTWKPYLETIDKEYWLTFARHIKVRIQTLAQFRDFCLYFFQEQPLNPSVIYSEKMKCDKETVDLIVPKIIELLEGIPLEDWNEEVLKTCLVELVQANGLKNGQVLRPIRAILT